MVHHGRTFDGERCMGQCARSQILIATALMGAFPRWSKTQRVDGSLAVVLVQLVFYSRTSHSTILRYAILQYCFRILQVFILVERRRVSVNIGPILCARHRSVTFYAFSTHPQADICPFYLSLADYLPGTTCASACMVSPRPAGQ